MGLEHKLMSEIRLWCGEHNLLCFRANVASVKMADGRYFNTGLPKGFPDLMVLDNDANIIFVETKVKYNKTSTEQDAMHRVLRARKFNVLVVYTLDEFINAIKTLAVF